MAHTIWRRNATDPKALDVDGFVMVFPSEDAAALAAAAPALRDLFGRLVLEAIHYRDTGGRIGETYLNKAIADSLALLAPLNPNPLNSYSTKGNEKQ